MVEKVFFGKVIFEVVKNIDVVFVWVVINIVVMFGVGCFLFMNLKKVVNWLRGKDDVLFYGIDIEFIGYCDFVGRRMSIDGFFEVVKVFNVEFFLFLELKYSGRKFYFRILSWVFDKSFRIWMEDEGNVCLNMFIFFVGEFFVFLVENSDVCGWEFFFERRFDVFWVIYNDWRGLK